MGVENAIIQFVSQGVEDVKDAADQIITINNDIVDSSKKVQQASQEATAAATEATDAVKQLSSEIHSTLTRLHQAAHLAEQLGRAAGVDRDSGAGEALDAITHGLGGAARGASLGGAIGGPLGAIGGGILGGLIGAAESISKTEERIKERELRLAAHDAKAREGEIVEAMLKQVGLSKADSLGGGSRHVQ